MFKRGLLVTVVLCISLRGEMKEFTYDLTMIGQVKFGGSVDRFPIAFADLFKNDFRINHVRTRGTYDFADVADDIVAIIDNPDKSPGRVALYFDVICLDKEVKADAVPDECFIKIAYSLVESTGVPENWVKILNEKFDVVITADEFYRDVYRKSGVTIPLYVLPHGIYIEELLQQTPKAFPSYPFTFGATSAFWPRKNQLHLLEAFNQEFGNDPHVRLQLHGRTADNYYFRNITKRLEELNCANIELIHTTLSDKEYKDFFKALDCYVLLSKGEGFSITPREALALGKPTIITNNTAHETICTTGHVYAVPADIVEPITNWHVGYEYNCEISDVRKALREVYNNYVTYAKKAQAGREWVKQYLWENLKQRFMNFVKPKKVLLGEEDRVTDEYLMTTSEELYKKYQQVINETAVDSIVLTQQERLVDLA